MAGALPSLVIPEARVLFFATPSHWLPVTVSIVLGMVIAGLMGHPGLSDRTKIRVGLAFEVLGSAGIASAEYQHIAAPIRYIIPGPGNFGLSWVAAWVLFVATVPIAYAIGVARGVNVPLESTQFFLALIFPYSVVLLMAHTASRVVYRPGGRSAGRAKWGATTWWSNWGKAAWARCGGPSTGCSPARPRSSSSGPSGSAWAPKKAGT